jgi:hypothetical protein
VTPGLKNFLKIAAILAAATVGDGVFALPYVFQQSGWLLGIFYLALLTAIVVIAHLAYLKTLERVNEEERLLGLTKKYLGSWGFGMGFFSIVAGLILSLVAILILGARFTALLFPAMPALAALISFWLFFALPLLLKGGRVVKLELLGIFCTSAIIILVFAVAWPNVSFGSAPAVNTANAFLPFGVILFALAGWTGIEPAYWIRKKEKIKGSSEAAIAAGTVFSSLLYILFVLGILGSATAITPDTFSGITGWPIWERTVLFLLGLLAVWTVSMPISREIKNALEKDLKWNSFTVKSLILFTPLILVLLGFNNFLVVVGFVGGLFLSLQYFLIAMVGRRVLELTALKKFTLDLIAAIFIIAAVYEIYYFVVG